MKKLMLVLLTLMLSVGSVYAEGGKNQGDTGQGNTSTGTSSQGSSQQSRTGR